MSKLIFYTLMSLWLGGLTVALTGCASDNGYERYSRNDGSGKTWQEKAFEPKGGGAHLNSTSDILSGGL
jgi:hypothetical protein